ncbi:hypothetical protein C4B60_00400 [Jeotgalibacillus proteolyticus]|uniref:Uncharacterized protein n=2 Tax=Jeotgalibacillus proteolyticus TaxID=2082395 RepID=A0A2S5GG23_9BACL|nr:hypothetical protein C4B60_00400 [Jeotgalibacillus proteolyticus]
MEVEMMDRIEHEDLPYKNDHITKAGHVKAHQLLESGLKEDEVQELSEHREDGWEFVDES